MRIDSSKVKRILFITLSNVGDAVLTTPVMDVLIKRFPDARVDVLLSPGVKDIFEKNPDVSKIYVYNKKHSVFEKYRLFKKLRGIRYDMIADMKNTIFPVLLMPKYRTVYFRNENQKLHKKDAHLAILSRMGIDVSSAAFNFFIAPGDTAIAEKFSKDAGPRGYVVINAGAKSHMKRWPSEKFGELADRLMSELGVKVALVGADGGARHPDSDRVVVDNVKKTMKLQASDLVGKTSVGELAQLLKHAKCVITNDSGPLHIASAVNASTVAIFGPTDPVKYGPLAEKSVVIRSSRSCLPCQAAECGKGNLCLSDVTVQEVFESVRKICGY